MKAFKSDNISGLDFSWKGVCTESAANLVMGSVTLIVKCLFRHFCIGFSGKQSGKKNKLKNVCFIFFTDYHRTHLLLFSAGDCYLPVFSHSRRAVSIIICIVC